MESHCVSQAGVQWHDLSSMQHRPPGFKQYSCLSLQSHWKNTHAPPHQANVLYLVDMGFHFVGHTGLEPLTSGDPRTSASQRSEIIGVSHHTQPNFELLNLPLR